MFRVVSQNTILAEILDCFYGASEATVELRGYEYHCRTILMTNINISPNYLEEAKQCLLVLKCGTDDLLQHRR